MKTIIRKIDALDLCVAIGIIILLGISVFYAYRYDNPQILSGVGIGIAIGALVVATTEHIDHGDSKQ